MKKWFQYAVFFAIFMFVAALLRGDGHLAGERLVSGIGIIIFFGALWAIVALFKKGKDKLTK